MISNSSFTSIVSSSWGNMFFLPQFFNVFVVTITSCKNVVTPWAKSASTDFIRKSTRNLVQKTKSCSPSPIQSRSSVLCVILLSYINIAEGGVGDTLCCITRWTVISCRGNISQLLLQLFVALEFWESLKENALKKKLTPLPTLSLFRIPIIVPQQDVLFHSWSHQVSWSEWYLTFGQYLKELRTENLLHQGLNMWIALIAEPTIRFDCHNMIPSICHGSSIVLLV